MKHNFLTLGLVGMVLCAQSDASSSLTPEEHDAAVVRRYNGDVVFIKPGQDIRSVESLGSASIRGYHENTLFVTPEREWRKNQLILGSEKVALSSMIIGGPLWWMNYGRTLRVPHKALSVAVMGVTTLALCFGILEHSDVKKTQRKSPQLDRY